MIGTKGTFLGAGGGLLRLLLFPGCIYVVAAAVVVRGNPLNFVVVFVELGNGDRHRFLVRCRMSDSFIESRSLLALSLTKVKLLRWHLFRVNGDDGGDGVASISGAGEVERNFASNV